MLRGTAFLPFALLLLACGAGGTSAAPAQSPQAPGPAAQEPLSESGGARPAKGVELPPGVPAPAEECQPFAAREAGPCSSASFEDALAAALSESGLARDRQLACLEKSTQLPAGWLSALRADLAPRGCADALLTSESGGAARELADTLVALRVGAALYRTVRQPPLPRPPFDKPAFLKHFQEVLRPWIVEQAQAVDALSKVGPRLSGYARAVVALEAGLADMRFVGVARAVELPKEMQSDPEIRETYLVALEQALEPRVARGRDAALVGLGELSRQGITADARLKEARALLSELYAGRRLDALDKLLLPALPALETDTAQLKIAAKLPAFYALKLSAEPNVNDAKLLRARLEQGVPPALWLDSKTPSSAELAALSQRALFGLGQLYFWSEPFSRAASTEISPKDDSATFIGALAKVLSRGPRNAAALMLGPTTLPPELRETQSVDAIAKSKSPVAGMAELDAAYLRGLAPPANDPKFWKEQAARFARAQQKLSDKSSKALAADLAKAALATEKELRRQTKP